MYCINILTSTFIGVGYELGDWTGANVNNVGFVARLLNDYFPTTPRPANLPRRPDRRPSQKAAAVQAAIWYFSDNYVLSTTDPLHDTVAGHRQRRADPAAARPAGIHPASPSRRARSRAPPAR